MIQRILHIICDKCGAEGPMKLGEKRPALLQEILQLGWKINGALHVCMECVKPLTDKYPQEFHITQLEHHHPDGRVETIITDVKVEDRSQHWTEARKKESAQ